MNQRALESTQSAGRLTSAMYDLIFRFIERHNSLGIPHPQVVLIGDLKKGTRSFFERLIGVALIPLRHRITVPIRICFSRNDVESQSICVVTNISENVKFADSPRVLDDLESVPAAIKDEMDKIMANVKSAAPEASITLKREIKVDIQGPCCVNLDFVKLPSVVAWDDDGSDTTSKLIHSFVQEESRNSIFILIHDSETIRLSTAAKAIASLKLQGKTIGILTKLDNHEQSEAQEILKEMNENMKLRFSWLTTSNKDSMIDGYDYGTQIDRLSKLNINENLLLKNGSYDEISSSGCAGLLAVEKRLGQLLDEFMAIKWVHHLRLVAVTNFEEICVQSINLGYPMAATPKYSAKILSILTQLDTVGYSKYRIILAEETSEQFKSKFNARVVEVTQNLGWMEIDSLEALWARDYDAFVADTNNAFANPVAFEKCSEVRTKYIELVCKKVNAIAMAMKDFSYSLISKFIEAFMPNENFFFEMASFLPSLHSKFDDIDIGKWSRYSLLINNLKAHIAAKIHLKMDEFLEFAAQCLYKDECFQDENLLSNGQEFGILKDRTTRNAESGTVECSLEWNIRVDYIPHRLFQKWRELLVLDFTNIITSWEIPPDLFIETCQVERIAILDQMQSYCDFLGNLIQLEINVIANKRETGQVISPRSQLLLQNAELAYWGGEGVALTKLDENNNACGYLVSRPERTTLEVKDFPRLNDSSSKFHILDAGDNNGDEVIYSPSQNGFLVSKPNHFESERYDLDLNNLHLFDANTHAANATRFSFRSDPSSPPTISDLRLTISPK